MTEIDNRENDQKKKKIITKVSLKDKGKLVESIYYKKERKTKYVFLGDGEIKRVNNYKLNNILYTPPNFHSKVLGSRTLILPTDLDNSYCKNNNENIADIIENFIYKYVDISPQDRKIATHYVIMTWIYISSTRCLICV